MMQRPDRGKSATTGNPRTLAEIQRDIVLESATEHGVTSGPPTRSETTLGGERAVVEEIAAYEYPARGGEFVTYVGAMHEGRPFLLRIWTGAESGTDPILPIVLEGLSFTDPATAPDIEQPESVDGFRTFVAPDGSFEVRLPEAWEAMAGPAQEVEPRPAVPPDPFALYLRDRVNTLTIRGADSEGSIVTCE